MSKRQRLSGLKDAAMSGNKYFLTAMQSESMPETTPVPANHPRLSKPQLEALLLLCRGDFVLSDDGQYALEESGTILLDITIRKPTLKTLAERDMAKFVEKGHKLLWRITQKGRAASAPSSPWRRPAAPPGRAPKPRPLLEKKPMIAKRGGVVIYFVDHPLAMNQAFTTVKEATHCARRIQAGYAATEKEIPAITVEHRRYVAFSQKLLVRILNNQVSSDDIVERWSQTTEPHANTRTYSKYEAILK